MSATRRIDLRYTANLSSPASRPSPTSRLFRSSGLRRGWCSRHFGNGGVSLQHIRRAVSILDGEIGIEHALASQRVYTDGAVILFDYADALQNDELAGLTEVVSRQRVFAPVVREYLSANRVRQGRLGPATGSHRPRAIASLPSTPGAPLVNRSSSTAPRLSRASSAAGRRGSHLPESHTTSGYRLPTSRTTCVPQSLSPPEFFLDRSLGGHDPVAAALRAGGWIVRTHIEVFGNRDEQVEDVEWLALCGQMGWSAITMDRRVRYRPTEIAAVRRHRVRLFALTSGDLTAASKQTVF